MHTLFFASTLHIYVIKCVQLHHFFVARICAGDASKIIGGICIYHLTCVYIMYMYIYIIMHNNYY